MKLKVHTESKMVKAVQELESGIDAETVARNHGISKATLYNRKSKYSGMKVRRAIRLLAISLIGTFDSVRVAKSSLVTR